MDTGSPQARVLAPLAEDPPRSVVGGRAMHAWRIVGGAAPPALDAAGLRAFAESGWVRVGLDFVLEHVAGGTRLSSETRVVSTDARSRRKFGPCLLVIGAGSGLIRRNVVRAVARRAEGSA